MEKIRRALSACDTITSMQRDRSAGIVIKEGKVLLMRRFNNGEEYWVFPGGGVEEGETAEHAAVREIAEETTVIAVPKRLLYHISWDTGEENFFYLCDYVSGEPVLPEDSVEFKQAQEGNQTFEPLWIDIEEMHKLKIYQLEVRDLFLEDYKNGFSDQVRELSIKVAERRQQ